jgi:hypothetical protein
MKRWCRILLVLVPLAGCVQTRVTVLEAPREAAPPDTRAPAPVPTAAEERHNAPTGSGGGGAASAAVTATRLQMRVVVLGDDPKGEVLRRLGELGFEATPRPAGEIRPALGLGVDAVYLPSSWAESGDDYALFEEHAHLFREYVAEGGALVVCQPNPYGHVADTCSPSLLPYAATFHNWYQNADAARVVVDAEHPITRGLSPQDVPFPADRIVHLDPRYRTLALGGATESPSLAVAEHGLGRIVIFTCSDSRGATVPLPDRTLRRIIEWAATGATSD